MVLVDTSVWVEHFRVGKADLAELLVEAEVLIHPFIVGELACGNLKDRVRVLHDLTMLPSAKPALNDEVMHFIEHRRIWGEGIGWVDAHLLASALITKCQFWTLDKRLHQIAHKLGIGLIR